MTVKYKVSDFAKDLSISAKKVLDELNAMGSTGKKNSSTLEENELNYLLEKFSKDNSVKSLDEFLNSAKAPKAEPKQEKPAVKAEKPAPKQEKPAEKPQKLSITTDDNTPRLVKAAPADFVPEKLEFERPPRRERSDRPRRDRGDRNGRDRRPRRPREDRPITPSVPKERELIPVSEAGMQQAEKLATDFVTGLLAKMGVEGQVKTLPQVECDQLRLEISGPDMGPIIGRRGDTLDAIQYLGSLVLNNALDEHVRLSVDTENYREKRAESLERLARKMAMKVVKAHRSMTLEPMNPYERRIIHAALQDFNGVTTYSTGTEPGRRVVIAPDNSYRNRDRG